MRENLARASRQIDILYSANSVFQKVQKVNGIVLRTKCHVITLITYGQSQTFLLIKCQFVDIHGEKPIHSSGIIQASNNRAVEGGTKGSISRITRFHRLYNDL